MIDDRPIFRIHFGTEDMHSHYRWNAIRPFIDVQAEETLEVAGGDGRMSFELVDELDYSGSIVISEWIPGLWQRRQRRRPVRIGPLHRTALRTGLTGPTVRAMTSAPSGFVGRSATRPVT